MKDSLCCHQKGRVERVYWGLVYSDQDKESFYNSRGSKQVTCELALTESKRKIKQQDRAFKTTWCFYMLKNIYFFFAVLFFFHDNAISLILRDTCKHFWIPVSLSLPESRTQSARFLKPLVRSRHPSSPNHAHLLLKAVLFSQNSTWLKLKSHAHRACVRSNYKISSQ